MTKLLRVCVLALTAVLACSETIAPPQPGTLTIELTTPHPGDGAILLRVTGPTPVTGLTSATEGHALHERASDGVVRVAVFGALSSGALATFTVPDVARVSEYSATIVEVSDAANALRADLGGYRLTVRR